MAAQKPKVPPVTAPKSEHQKYAREVLADPEYKQKPKDYRANDTVEGG